MPLEGGQAHLGDKLKEINMADLSGEDADVVAIANTVFTDEAKATYADAHEGEE